MPTRVIPICTVDRKRLGLLANSRAIFALWLPFFMALSSLNFRAETKAISLIEKIPFSNIRETIKTILGIIAMLAVIGVSIKRRVEPRICYSKCMNTSKSFKKSTILIILVLIILAGAFYFTKNRKTEVYQAPPTTKAEQEPILISKVEIKEENFSGSTVKISDGSELGKVTQEFIDQTVSDFRTQANTDVPDMRAQFGADSPTANYTIDITANQVKSKDTESVVIGIYTYTGGAHGNSAYKVFTYSKDGKALTLSDVIKSEKQKAFTDYLKNELKSSSSLGVFPESVDDLTFQTLTSWSLDDKNLNIYFGQYEIGPGVLGAVTFPISLEKIKDFLK